MITDSQDPWAEIRRVVTRIRHLETANPLENASISTGRIRVLTPGGDGESSSEEAIIGHAYGKKGVLVKDGGQWMTTKEYADGKIAASHEYPNARITSLESFANAYGPTVNTHGTRLTAVEGVASTANTKAGNAQTTANTALSTANGKASQSKLNEVIDAINDLEAYVRSQHPGKISVPPIVKG